MSVMCVKKVTVFLDNCCVINLEFHWFAFLHIRDTISVLFFKNEKCITDSSKKIVSI
jgi:hypothetical protein